MTTWIDQGSSVEPRSRMRWREGVGRLRVGNVYAQAGPKPADTDELVCIADTANLAVHIIAAHNSMLRFGPE